MSDAPEAVAVVPAHLLDELLNVTHKLWEWLWMADERYVKFDLAGFLRTDWRSAEDFIDYIEQVIEAVERHYQPPFPSTDW